jgi:hypothetical protein
VRNPVVTAEAVFVGLPAIFGHTTPKGLIRDVFRTLRFCIKGIERGSTKGFIGDTK